MPAHARIILRGQGGGAVSWLYAVDSLDVRPVSERDRAALLDWKCTGSLRSPGTHTVAAGERSRERTHLHRQTNTGKQIQAGEDAQVLNPTASSSPEPPRQLVKTATSEHRIQGGKE